MNIGNNSILFFGAILAGILAGIISSFIYAVVYGEKVNKKVDWPLFLRVLRAIALSAEWILIPTTLYFYMYWGTLTFMSVIFFALCIFRFWILWKQFNKKTIILLISFILAFYALVYFGADFFLG